MFKNRKPSEGWTYFDNSKKNISPTFNQDNKISSLQEEQNASQ